ncbi:MAG: polysaccharide deacetylase family protein [Bacteroidales bacterium]|nr:polysaccharide deacetylase family protein [Bacteroidales bacterium]
MKTNNKLLFTFAVALLFISCTSKTSNKQDNNKAHISEGTDTISVKAESIIEEKIINSAEKILEKKEVPILCYHRIEDGRDDIYSVSPAIFASHLQILSDSGYNSVLPDELYNYLVHNTTLPDKPFIISFDDSRTEHYTISTPELEKRNFKGVFFIMTVTNNKKNYLSTDEIVELSDRGHSIGLHSWDHVMATKYSDSSIWEKQVYAPKKKLEDMIDKPIDYWAYPNGVYNREAAEELDKHFKLSFILLAKKDSLYPLQTIRRMIVPSDSPERLLQRIKNTYN